MLSSTSFDAAMPVGTVPLPMPDVHFKQESNNLLFTTKTNEFEETLLLSPSEAIEILVAEDEIDSGVESEITVEIISGFFTDDASEYGFTSEGTVEDHSKSAHIKSANESEQQEHHINKNDGVLKQHNTRTHLRHAAKGTKNLMSKFQSDESVEDPTSAELSCTSTSIKNKLKPGAVKKESSTLSCDLCQKEFTNAKKLFFHKKTVHEDSPAECEKCNKVFKNIELLKVHYRRSHPANAAVREARLMRDKIKKQQARAVAIAQMDIQFCCNKCNMKFGSQRALTIHENSHVAKDGTNCLKCNKQFKNIILLKSHIAHVHSSKANITTGCPECNLTFKNKANLKAHNKRAHQYENNETSLSSEQRNNIRCSTLHTCDVCKSEFKQLSHFKAHLRIHEPDNGIRHQCELCPSKFRWEDSLQTHIRLVHHQLEPIICDECGKSFANRINFNQHSKLHLNGTWHCQFCDKTFSNPIRHRDHERKTHGKMGIYQCASCDGLSFKSPAALEKHTRFNHPEHVKNHYEVKRRKPKVENLLPGQAHRDLTSLFSDVIDFHVIEFLDDDINPTPANLKENSDNENKLFKLLVPENFASQNLPNEMMFIEDAKPMKNHKNLNDWNGSRNTEFPETLLSKVDVIPATNQKIAQNQIPNSPLTCPKLQMKTTVKLKRYIPVPNRKGKVFCDLCCINFVNSFRLSFHMKQIHEVVYSPPKSSKVSQRKKSLGLSANNCDIATRNEEKQTNSQDLLMNVTSKPVETADSEVLANKEESIVNNINEESDKMSCKICKRVFKAKNNLVRHMRNKHENSALPCQKCNKIFKNYSYLARHVRYNHFEDKISCEICNKEFRSFLVLNRHKRRVHRKKTFRCTICNFPYKSSESLRQHTQQVHNKANLQRFKCDQCTYIGLTKYRLQIHIEACHALPGIKYQCEICGRSYKNRFALRAHKESHSQNFRLQCLFCSKVFNRTKTKREHEGHVHWDWEVNGFSCKICKERFKSSAILEKHVINAHSKEDLETWYYESAKLVNPSSPPPKASASIDNNDLLVAPPPQNEHEDILLILDDPIHLTKNAFEFNEHFEVLIPSSTADTSIALHQNSTINPSNEKLIQNEESRHCLKNKGGRGRKTPVEVKLVQEAEKRARTREKYAKPKKCSFCQALCKNEVSRRKHMAIAHPEMVARKCDICNLTFVNAREFRRHNIQNHFTNKPYCCSTCGAEFSANTTYRRHMQTHNGPVSCSVCGKQYKTTIDLKDHLRIRHGVRQLKTSVGVGLQQSEHVQCPETNVSHQYSSSARNILV